MRKVVVFLPPTMGDCVNHLATLRWLRDGLPGREIVAVSSGLGLEILRTWSIEGIEVWDRNGLWWKLLRGRFDLGLFPYVQNKMVRLARLAGVRHLVGLRGGKHDDWFAAGVDKVAGEHQVLDLCRRLFGELGFECGTAEWDTDGLVQLGIYHKGAGFMTGASRPDKKWPEEKFRFVAQSMKGRGYLIYNFGGQEEDGALDGIEDIDFAEGIWSFDETAEKLMAMDILVTNDTGLMHLAGAVGTPVVGIFMVESPEEYFPPGDGHELLRGDVSVEDVLAAVDRILERGN
ncbi:MAG: glycosyltransferase family 9 protein [Fimbriimonadaceae bacterium]